MQQLSEMLKATNKFILAGADVEDSEVSNKVYLLRDIWD